MQSVSRGAAARNAAGVWSRLEQLGDFGETLVVDWGLAKVLAVPEHDQEGAGSTSPWLFPSTGSDSDLTRTGQALA